MTSINSSNKFLPMLKNVFRRNLAHFIVTQIIMLLITVSYLRNSLDLKPYAVLDITETYSLGIVGFFSVLFVFEGFILAVTVFREIYSKRASDFYFSMPVRRGTYYNTNILFGVMNAALAYVVSFVLSVIVIKTDIIYPSKFYIFDVSYFARVMLVSLLAVLAVLAIFMLCAVVSGKKWHYVLLSFIAVMFAFLGIIELIGYINTIWGLWIDISKAWIVSPMGILLSNIQENSPKQTAILCAAAIIQFIAAYAIGFIVFKKRKAEIAEFSLSGRIVPAVMIIGCLITDFLVNLNVVDIPIYKRIISGIIVAAVTTVILTAICYKKAITKGTLKCFGGAVIITAVIIACVEFLPSADYIKYVPEAREVESVTIYNDVDYSSPNITDFLYGMAFGYYDDYLDDDNYVYSFSSDDAKEKLCNLHKKIVSDETQKNAFGEDYYTYGNHSIKIKYNLKNGKTVTRSYCVGTNDVYQEYAALMQTEEGLNQLEPFNLESDSILFAYLTNNNDYYYDDYNAENDFSSLIMLDEYNTLFDKMKIDRRNEAARSFIENSDSGFNMWYFYDYDDTYQDIDTVAEPTSEIILYTFSDNVSEEEKERLSKMTPEEIINYEDTLMVNSDYDAPRILETYEYIFDDSYKETCSYLNELGYSFNTAA